MTTTTTGSNSVEDMFETSCNEDVEMVTVNRSNHNSVSQSESARSSHVEKGFPEPFSGMKLVLEHSDGLLFRERFESFISNNWPFDVKQGNLCHPKALAMAGLGFHSLQPKPSAQCQVCLTVLHDLQPNSNPWILHSEANPDCCLIKLGQRQEVDDYRMDEVVEMIHKKLNTRMKLHFKEREIALKKKLYALCQSGLNLSREVETVSLNSSKE